MEKSIFSFPSLYAHILNGILLFIAFFLFFKNYSKICRLEPYKLIILTLLFSACVGIHGISHLGMEKIYRFNPLSTILLQK
uniref:DUF4405 domain-containing protein n=1 Tax=viral metagenome TaxID=1070528 RepID=A0A6C0DEZ5_9ZZZZ